MEHLKTINEPVTKVVDITCDICNRSCKTECSPEYMHLYAMWGYCSPWDNQCWEAHICPQCVQERLEPIVKFKKV